MGVKDAPANSAVLLHVSGSSPTGAELTAHQWRLVATILRVSKIHPILNAPC